MDSNNSNNNNTDNNTQPMPTFTPLVSDPSQPVTTPSVPDPNTNPFMPIPESSTPTPIDPAANPAPTWPPQPINPTPETPAPQPVPTFTPPVSPNTESAENSTTPWNTPPQSPVSSSSDQTMVQPSFQSMPAAPSNLTDLSIGQSNETLPSTPVPQPETLVVPSPSSEQPQTVTSNSGGFPKWVLLAGILIILGVAGASAYFILGIGQPKQNTPLILEEQQNPIIQPVNKINPEVVQPSPTTSSASFNNLTGATISPTKAASGSAIDLLRRLVTPTP